MPKTTKNLKSSRVYGYTTEMNGTWITKQAKKAGITKAAFVHSIIENARKNKYTVTPNTVQKAAKRVK